MRRALAALLFAAALPAVADPPPPDAPVLFASAPPPATAETAVWRWQGEDHLVVVLSEEQARRKAGELVGCREQLDQATTEAERAAVPWWMWIAAGAFIGIGAGVAVAHAR